jgi:hypothetical protein
MLDVLRARALFQPFCLKRSEPLGVEDIRLELSHQPGSLLHELFHRPAHSGLAVESVPQLRTKTTQLIRNFKSNWAFNFQNVCPGNPRMIALYANGALTLMLLQPTPLNGMRSDMSSNLQHAHSNDIKTVWSSTAPTRKISRARMSLKKSHHGAFDWRMASISTSMQLHMGRSTHISAASLMAGDCIFTTCMPIWVTGGLGWPFETLLGMAGTASCVCAGCSIFGTLLLPLLAWVNLPAFSALLLLSFLLLLPFLFPLPRDGKRTTPKLFSICALVSCHDPQVSCEDPIVLLPAPLHTGRDSPA